MDLTQPCEILALTLTYSMRGAPPPGPACGVSNSHHLKHEEDVVLI